MKKLFNSRDEMVYRRNDELDKSVIGKGTFSEVRLVSHKNNPNVLYALKDMEKTNECEIIYIKKEIDIHIKLDHPHIVKFHDYLELDDCFLFFLEYCENGDLFDYMVKNKPSKSFLLQKFYELCQAVKYLHEKNVMHRDLKPENIFLDRNLRVKLGDFGWSAVYSDQSVRESLCGTLFYNAYEIFAENKQTKKTDIWSLGILLFLFYHNYVPFQAENVVQMMKILKNCERILSFRKNLDPLVKDLIQKILRLKPENRPTIEQILEHPVFDQFRLKSTQKSKKNIVFKRKPEAFKKKDFTFKKQINNSGSKSPQILKKDYRNKNEQSSGSKHKVLSVKSNQSGSQRKLGNTSSDNFKKQIANMQNEKKFIKVKVNQSLQKAKEKFQLKNDKKWFNIYAKHNAEQKSQQQEKPRKISEQLHTKIRPSVDKMPGQNFQRISIQKRLSISNKKNYDTTNNVPRSIYQPTVLNEYFTNDNHVESESKTKKDFKIFKNKQKLQTSQSKDHAKNKKKLSTSSTLKPKEHELKQLRKKTTVSNTDNANHKKDRKIKSKQQASQDIRRKDKSKTKVNAQKIIKDLENSLRKISSIKDFAKGK